MDRSFNQQLFEGLVDFNNNKKMSSYKIDDADSSKPSQDNPMEFINIYTSVMKDHYIIGLAGFNHATPMNQMMVHNNDSPYASCSSSDTDKIAKRTSFILLDANVSDNQNVASVQFRSDQPGFLTAMAVCDYFYHNLQIYHNKHQNISVGAFGGVQLPTVLTYMGGFQRGIELFNHEVLQNRILKNGAS
ncbi:MAG: BMP family ABC transporter substrate-binding protein [Mycoplasmoidaceae bacterium]|nr:BMP family ABC transporter substrate-binding protein [Mycoplasmoidaceae bacterium]